MSRLIDAEHFKRFLQALCKAGAPYDGVIQLLDKEPTVYEIDIVKKGLKELKQYRAIGTIEEFKALKEKKNVLPIAAIKISKEDMQKMIDEKVAQIELDIQKIRAKAIDEFTHQLKENLNQEFPSNYESTRPYFSLENARLIVDDVAEQMKAGGIDG